MQSPRFSQRVSRLIIDAVSDNFCGIVPLLGNLAEQKGYHGKLKSWRLVHILYEGRTRYKMNKALLMMFVTLATIAEPCFAVANFYCKSTLDGHTEEEGPGNRGGFHDAGLIYDKMFGYCSRGSDVFRFKARGLGYSARMGSFQYMTLICLNDNLEGRHWGLSYSAGAAVNLNGAVFVKPGYQNVCQIGGIGNGIGASITYKDFVFEKLDCNEGNNSLNIDFCRK